MEIYSSEFASMTEKELLEKGQWRVSKMIKGREYLSYEEKLREEIAWSGEVKVQRGFLQCI